VLVPRTSVENIDDVNTIEKLINRLPKNGGSND
jgi:hypothetical protein